MSGMIKAVLAQFFRLGFLPALLLILSTAFFVPLGFAQEQSATDKLDDVKRAIVSEKETIKQVNQQRQKLQAQLKRDEIAIADSIKTLSSLKQSLSKTHQKLKALAQQQQTLQAEKKHQETLLATQLRSAYSSGHHDYLKLILNQQKPSTVQRTVSYYQYLNKARINEIEAFKATLANLLVVEQKQRQESEKLEQFKSEQERHQQSLQAQQNSRKKTVSALNQQLLSSQQQLEKLIAEENNLTEALERIARLSKQEFDLVGLSQFKKKLNWPVKGKVIRNFGSRKQGYLKWKGMLISAPVGRSVNTIHNGVVLFSDWLKGYGLLTVIDHGEGYMSLYGHNQALLKSVGDRVEMGEPIALVGQTGGQTQSALYFEVRYQGKATNPRNWLR